MDNPRLRITEIRAMIRAGYGPILIVIFLPFIAALAFLGWCVYKKITTGCSPLAPMHERRTCARQNEFGLCVVWITDYFPACEPTR